MEKDKEAIEKFLQENPISSVKEYSEPIEGFYMFWQVSTKEARNSISRGAEDHAPESHLIPICLQTALGQRPAVQVFGTDWPTPDGTCVRDYVHVSDLVRAHLAVLDALGPRDTRQYNVGIGRGFSVRECIDSVRRVTGIAIASVDGPRRPGDPPVLLADASRIRSELGWEPSFTDLDVIVASAWAWFHAHPRGWKG